QLRKKRRRVGAQNLVARLALIHGEEDGNEPAHDMGIAVAEELQDRSCARPLPHGAGEPDLAGAAAHLVGIRPQRFGERRQRSPQLDDVAVAVLPIIEQGEVGANGVEGHAGPTGTGGARWERAASHAPMHMASARSGASQSAGRAPKPLGRLWRRGRQAPVRAILPRQAGVRSAGVSVPRVAPGCLGSSLPLAGAWAAAGSTRGSSSSFFPPELTRSMAMRAPNSAFLTKVAQSSAPAAQACGLRSQNVATRSTAATAVP